VPRTTCDYVGLLRWALALRHRDIAHIRELSSQLAAVCGRDPSDAAQAVARQCRGYLAVLDADFALARTELETAHRHALRCGADTPELDYGVRRLLSGVCVLVGDVPAALRFATEATESRFPAAWGSMRFALAMVKYFAGDPVGALAEVQAGIADARVVESEFAFDEASQLAETAIALHRGRPQDAPPLENLGAFEDPLLGCARVLYAGLVGDAEQITWLLRAGGRTAPLVDACADRVAGLTTADRLAAMGAPLLAAQVRLEYAERHGDAAAEVIADCLATFEHADAKPWLDRARRLARAHGLGALTKREKEIVLLVGDGLSNAEIAARLFLSERTVETHLRNGYRRLGIASRAALVKWVQQHRD
jgi:DNA-binding CsgD family transcriptional regulator